MLAHGEENRLRGALRDRALKSFQGFGDLSGPTLSAAAVSQISDDFQRDAVEYGEEVFFPTLALLSGAQRLASIQQEMLTKLDLEKLDRHWYQALSLRRSACLAALERIQQFALTQGATILAVFLLDGDPHNGGNRPIAFDLDSGGNVHRYVYKPIAADAHRVYDAISNRVCNRLNIRSISTPILYDGGKYCIRSFVPGRNSLTSSELRSYYYGFGVLISIAMTLEMTDLHFENILVSGDVPVMIDTEFLLPPRDVNRAKWSLVTSGLFAPEISPLNQVSQFSKIKGRIQDADLYYRYRFARIENYDLHVIKDAAGRATKSEEFRDMIQQGARDGHRVIAELSDDLFGECESLLHENFSSRHLLRNTSLYKIMQMRLWTPSPISFFERLDHVRSVLRQKRSLHSSNLQQAEIDQLVDREIMALRRGDIPYFWTNSSNTLFDSAGVVAKGFGRGTVKDRFRAGLFRMKARQPTFQMDKLFKRHEARLAA